LGVFQITLVTATLTKVSNPTAINCQSMSTNNRARQGLAPKPKQVLASTTKYGKQQESPPQQARRIVTSDDDDDDDGDDDDDDENRGPSENKSYNKEKKKKSNSADNHKKKKSNSADDHKKKKSNSADIRSHMASSDVERVRIDESNKSNYYDEEDDDGLLDEDRATVDQVGEDGEEEVWDERGGDKIHLDARVCSSRGSSNSRPGLPPRPPSSHSRSSSGGHSSGPGGLSPRPPSSHSRSSSGGHSSGPGESSRALSPMVRSSSEVSNSSPSVGVMIPQEVYGIADSATSIDPAMMRRIMKLPCAFPYANNIWGKHATKLTTEGAFQYVLTDDALRGVDLHDHFKLVFFFMFHLVMVNINEHNPRNLALNKLTWKPEWKCFHPNVASAIQTSAIFKGDLFKRRVEYFKRYLQEKIISRMPSVWDFKTRSATFHRRSCKWLTADHLRVLGVL
jgi:hypothetical protein